MLEKIVDISIKLFMIAFFLAGFSMMIILTLYMAFQLLGQGGCP